MDEIRKAIQSANRGKREHLLRGVDINKAETEQIEKSDIMEAISTGGEIKVSKTGKEIKEQVKAVIMPRLTSDLAVKEAEALEKLKMCGAAPTKDADKWWTNGIEIDCGHKIFDWDETYIPHADERSVVSSLSAEDLKSKQTNVPENQEQANCRREYNDIVRYICNIKADIMACDILKTVKGEKEFELSPRQVVALEFNIE